MRSLILPGKREASVAMRIGKIGAGRYRHPGDGQVDFRKIFTKLTEYGCDVWAVMEWECCIKSPEQGARQGAPFIQDLIIESTDRKFDDFAGGKPDEDQLKPILGMQ